MAEDSEWIFASIINFLQSPLWATPVFSYVDQHCIFFDKEDENKFEYTKIHEQYRELVEGLIDQHVIKELNITEEQFVNACQKEMDNAYSKVLFDQVLSADDFVCFKKMMFRRNLALENAALAAIQLRDKSAPLPAAQRQDLKDVGTADEQIELAIRLSKEAYEREKDKTNNTGDEEMKRAIERSMKEKVDVDEAQRREMADLEAAIALSLAAQKDAKFGTVKEEERVRILEMQQSLLRKQSTTDEKQHQVLLELQKQRLLDEDRQNAANSALDRLFARRKLLHTQEELITSDMGDEAKSERQQQILEQRNKILEHSNKERETELQAYLQK